MIVSPLLDKMSDEKAYNLARDVYLKLMKGYADGNNIAPVMNNERYWMSNSCCYVNIRKDGTIIKAQLNDACHARLLSDELAILYFNYVPQGFNILDLALYIQWLVNESAFAGIFLSKNVSDILKYGAVIDTNTHFGLSFAAAIASRTYHEHGANFITWLALAKAGVDKNVAYVIACATKSFHKAAPKYSYLYADNTDEFVVDFGYINHGGIDPINWGQEDVSRWMNKTPLDYGKGRKCADASFREQDSDWFGYKLRKFGQASAGKKFGAAVEEAPKTLTNFVAFVKEKIEPELLGLVKKEKQIINVKKKATGDEPEKDM